MSKFDKNVKKYVVDKEQKSQILDIRKESKKQRKVYLKQNRKWLKQFDKLNKTRGTTNEEFESLLSEKVLGRNSMQESEILRFMNVKEITSEEEWGQLFHELDKVEEEQYKNKAKKIKILNKQLKKSITKINKHYPEESSRDTIIQQFNSLHKLSIDYIHEFHNGIKEMADVIPSEALSSDSLLRILDDVNTAEDNVYKKAIECHYVIHNHTDEKEWKRLMKEVIKL